MKRSYSGDISGGRENVPVVIEGDVSEEHLPKFQYVTDNVPGPGCDLDPAEVTLPGCLCHVTSCSPPHCPCLRYGPAYTRDGHLLEIREPPECSESPYSRPVFECHVLCSCGDACQSRVVQNGVTVRLGVFRTPDARGWGVRALERLPRGQFVCQYAGEVLGLDEARRRQRAQGPGDANYIVVVQEHGAQLAQTCVDPAEVGNVGRFLNHSCQPNLVMTPVRLHSPLPRLALFACRDVEEGEELTFHYSGGAKDETGDEKRKKCLCRAPNCTGFLPLDMSVLN